MSYSCGDISVLLDLSGISGGLCSSVKQIKATSLFDWEQGIALYAMQVNWESSLSEREISCFFQVAAGNWGVFSSYGGGSH